MVKILIASDSHGLTGELQELIEKYKDDVDAFVHCGDSELGPDYKALEGYIGVTGNCDLDGKLPPSLVLNIEGMKIFVAHGHKYGVYYSLESLYEAAVEAGCSVALYGHSHVLKVDEREDCLLINPGSLSNSRSGFGNTYAILTIEDDVYDIKFFDLNGSCIF